MAEYPKDLKYTKDHEWARFNGDQVAVGVTWYAQDALGTVVYVELPKVGTVVSQGQSFGVVESTKSVSELFAPMAGTVTKVNDALVKAPEAINSDPYGAGWLIELRPASPGDAAALMDAAAYQKTLPA